jgi:hypothetical protein
MGDYTQIHNISAPQSAKYGDRVLISFWVKSLYTDYMWIATTLYSGDVLQVTSPDMYFTMPNVPSLAVDIESYFWGTGEGGESWVMDDQVFLTIAGVSEPQLSGFKISDFSKV